MTAFLESIGYNGWILPTLLGLPLVGAAALLLRPNAATPDAQMASDRRLALWVFVAEALLSLGLWWSVNVNVSLWQADFDVAWIPSWGVRFHLGLDGIALMLVLLTTLLMPLAVLGGWTSIREKTASYYALLLILTTGMLGVFMALDLVLFYVMWEVMLVPMYLIIGIWGGANRIYATIKFVLYTLVGSLLMLVAILATAFTYQAAAGTWQGAFDFETLRSFAGTGGFDPTFQLLAFGAFFLAFAIKVPMFPFHTWLPDAHVEAPTAGSVILAGVLLKLGGYGLIRFCLPLFPDAAQSWAPLIIVLSLIAIIYGAIVALVQPDLKKPSIHTRLLK